VTRLAFQRLRLGGVHDLRVRRPTVGVAGYKGKVEKLAGTLFTYNTIDGKWNCSA